MARGRKITFTKSRNGTWLKSNLNGEAKSTAAAINLFVKLRLPHIVPRKMI